MNAIFPNSWIHGSMVKWSIAPFSLVSRMPPSVAAKVVLRLDASTFLKKLIPSLRC